MEGAQVEVGTTLRNLWPWSCRRGWWLGLGSSSGGAEDPLGLEAAELAGGSHVLECGLEIRGHYSISRRFLLGWGPWSRFGGREGFDMFWVTTSPAFWTQSLLPCPNSPQTALGGIQRLASRMFIRERSWEGRRDGQREKLSCVTVLRTAKPQSTLDPEGPLELS